MTSSDTPRMPPPSVIDQRTLATTLVMRFNRPSDNSRNPRCCGGVDMMIPAVVRFYFAKMETFPRFFILWWHTG